MRRRLAILSALTVGAGVLVFAPANPAAANAVCAGTGTATVAPGLLYPFAPSTSTGGTSASVTLDGSEAAAFHFEFTVGACSNGSAVVADGTLSGYCGHSAGQGVTTDGFAFGYTSAGSVLVITGGLTGVANAVPNPLVTGNSCAASPTGATSFLVTGTVAKVHCGVTQTLSASLTQLLPPILFVHTVAGVTVGYHTETQSIHHSVHACVGVL